MRKFGFYFAVFIKAALATEIFRQARLSPRNFLCGRAKARTVKKEMNCEMTVAAAAPATPKSSAMNKMSSTMFAETPTATQSMG